LDVLPIRNLGARVVLDEHGVEADFLHEILASIGKSPTPIESAEVRFQEGVAIHAASSVFCCSEHDKARLSRLYGGRPSKYYVVQNGVDEEFFRPVEPYRFSERTVLYLGSFGHLPNLYAIDWIAKHVIPRVQHAIPEARFVFVGSGETPRVREGVFIRDVEDVRPYIHGAQVGLATVFHGSGSRLKILEYSACGLPVVASTKGIEGLSLKAGSEVLIADDPESVARAIIELLTNKALSTQLARNAMLRVRSEYTWIAIASKALPAYLK
jgi:glycosyltransferase involved in cell wall biosynthesis